METALIATEPDNSSFLLAVASGTAIAILCLVALAALLWRHRASGICASALNLSPANGDSRHEEEKSNNLQNEENFRRYANPLKGSVTSLRGAIELSMQPVPEISQTVTLAGPSIVHRSQPLFPASCDSEFDKDADTAKSHRGSQILLYKAQNPDMRKNTVGSIESPHKDFGKRSINCQSMPPMAIDQDVLTVHV